MARNLQDLSKQYQYESWGFTDKWSGIQGQSTTDWAKRWTSGLDSLKGFYDEGKLGGLMAGLGSASSSTLNKRLSALTAESAKVYNLSTSQSAFEQWRDRGYNFDAPNPNAKPDDWKNIDFSNPELQQGIVQGMQYMNFNNTGQGIEQGEWKGASFKNTGWDTYVDAVRERGSWYSAEQNKLVSEINAQLGREQSFVTQINQLTQTATQGKMKSEQAAAQKALQEQYNKGQADLNASAQQNAAKLAEQQKLQNEKFAAAQAEAAKVAQEQKTAFDRTAQATAIQNASAGQQQAQMVQNQALEQQASSLQTGPIVQGPATATGKSGKSTTRTSRWAAARSPASGGGGANV